MSGRGLLSRIGRGSSRQRHDEEASILEHLRVLLNTRRGEAPTVPDYGVPDITDLVYGGAPGGVTGLVRALRDTILTYEPRLKNVSVRNIASDEPLVIRFEITARLVEGNRVLKVQTRVRPGGKVDVG